MVSSSDDLETKVVTQELWENVGDAAYAINPAEMRATPPAEPDHPLVNKPTLSFAMAWYLTIVLELELG